jgi:hypothetical protein
MTWNWAQVVEDNKDNVKTFDLIPDGKYAVKVQSAESKTSSNGNPMIEMRLVITEGQFAARILFARATATEKAQAIFLRTLNAFGISNEWLVQAEPSFDQIAALLPDREAVAQVTKRTYQGTESNEVKNLFPKAASAPAASAAPAAAPAAASPFDAPAAPAAPASPFGSAPASPF